MVAVNLIPESLQTACARRAHLHRWSTAVVVSLVLALFPGGVEWFQQERAAQLRQTTSQLRTEVETVRGELKAVTAAAVEVSLQVERAEALRSKRSWSAMMALIAGALPTDCWLTSIATDPATPTGTGTRPVQPSPSTSTPKDAAAAQTPIQIEGPRKLKISGYALDAAHPHAFVLNLREADVFSNVTLERSQREIVLGVSSLRFDLTCEW